MGAIVGGVVGGVTGALAGAIVGGLAGAATGAVAGVSGAIKASFPKLAKSGNLHNAAEWPCFCIFREKSDMLTTSGCQIKNDLDSDLL